VPEPDDPLIGTELGRYRLERLIGRGGMGRVYLGVRPDIGSRVAIKVLSADCAENPALVERFFTEARAVNLIAHENIVSVIDLDRTGRPFIVMEYVEGPTLRDLLATGPLPLGGLVEVILDVLLGLDAAHAAGIVHRDLKPDNVIVTALGRAKLLDFGIAKLAERPGVRTATGTMLGTPHYMAPEQITGATCDARTDVYALGVLMFELVTGERPFHGDTDFALMEHHVRTPAPSAVALRPDLPEPIADVISRALAKVPTDRFPTARAMADALRDATADLDETVLAPFPPAALRPAAVAPSPSVGTAATVVDSPARAAEPVGPVGRDLNAATQDIAPPTRPGKSRPRVDGPRASEAEAAPAPVRGTLTRRATIILGTMAGGAVIAAIAVGIYVMRLPSMTTPIDAPIAIVVGPVADAPALVVAELEPDAAVVDAAVIGADSAAIATPPDAPASNSRPIKRTLLPPDPQCADKNECKQYGLCAWVNEACVRSESGCAESMECKNSGRCSVKGDLCVPTTTSDCKRSYLCRWGGYCKLGDDKCVPANDAACARSTGCTDDGMCKLAGTECVATPASCAASRNCLQNNRCVFGTGHCWAKPNALIPDFTKRER
jgi:serine/threonine-protein kinase